MSLKIILAIYVAIGLFSAPAAMAVGGSMVSGGGETITDEHNPWFLGDEEINFCVADVENFSLEKSVALGLIRQAWVDWFKTLQKLRTDQTHQPLPDGKKRKMTLKTRELPCTDPKVEITFYLGKTPEHVQTFLNYHATRTVGFTQRTSYDENIGRGKGFVWISPDLGPNAYRPNIYSTGELKQWNQPDRFYNVVLHELGHIFGIQHIQGTFMDEKFPSHQMRPIQDEVRMRRTANELYLMKWQAGYGPTILCGEIGSGDGVGIGESLGLGEHTYSDSMCVESIKTADYQSGYAARIKVFKGATLQASFEFVQSTSQSEPYRLSGQYKLFEPGWGTALYTHYFTEWRSSLHLVGTLKTATGDIPAVISLNHSVYGTRDDGQPRLEVLVFGKKISAASLSALKDASADME